MLPLGACYGCFAAPEAHPGPTSSFSPPAGGFGAEKSTGAPAGFDPQFVSCAVWGRVPCVACCVRVLTRAALSPSPLSVAVPAVAAACKKLLTEFNRQGKRNACGGGMLLVR